MINIQEEAQKIHSRFGITEMANYQIQLLADRYAKEYHDAELKKLRVTDVSGELVCDLCDEDGWITENDNGILTHRLCKCDKAN